MGMARELGMAREAHGHGEGRKRKGKGRGDRPKGGDPGPMPALLASDDARGPDFLCIGAQKAGTRWLFDQLAFHPDFWMPPIKELHYLNQNKRFMRFARPALERGEKNLRAANRWRARQGQRPLVPEDMDWLRARIWLKGHGADLDPYARLFSPKGARLSGDICPQYAVVPDAVAQAMRHRFPDARIVYLVRDPIDRFWSHYSMIVRRHPKPSPESVETVRDFVERGTGQVHSDMNAAIDRWRQGRDDPNFGLFFFDDLKTDAAGLRRRIIGFLGGDPDRASDGIAADHNRKARFAKVEMSDGVRDYLAGLFAGDIRRAATELGGPAEAWQKKYGL